MIKKIAGRIFVSFAALLAAVAVRGDIASPEIKVMRLPSGLRFGLIGERPSHPAPTLFLIAASLEKMRDYTEISPLLVDRGFLDVTLDPPAHGEDRRPGEPTDELEGWRGRLDKGEDFVGEFIRNARAVLDYLVQQGYTDPNQVGACGNSRGGFLAFQFAAAEPRVKAVAGLSLLADLMTLREFRGTAHRAAAERLSLVHVVPKLAGRPVWVSIGNHDVRVDTDSVIDFTRALVRYSAQWKPDNALLPVTLIVAPSRGHSKIARCDEIAAGWFLEQFGQSPSIPSP
jgi:pimeloyl-ACP methyl ester carboxylesterase